jgi:hypothetical protein
VVTEPQGSDRPRGGEAGGRGPWFLLAGLAALLVLLGPVVRVLRPGAGLDEATERIAFPELMQRIEKGRVESITVRGLRWRGEYRPGEWHRRFRTEGVDVSRNPEVLEALREEVDVITIEEPRPFGYSPRSPASKNPK